MEAASIVSKYVYEKDGTGLKGGYPLIAAHGDGDGPTTSQVGGATQHLAIPIGIVVVREYSVPIAQYDEPVSDGCVDDELFEKMLRRVGHREHVPNNMTKKNDKEGSIVATIAASKKSTKKHHKAKKN